MITAYKHALHHPSQIIETEINHSASWINVVEPDREEIEGLMEFTIYLRILFEIR